MLRIAIKEQNRHFEHGLKIIMARLVNQWQQKIYFLPPEEMIMPMSHFWHWMMIGSAQAVTRYRCIPNISCG
ncbi:fimbriae regulatory protein FimW [Salmonella enterica subsp. arizonae]|uniref:Fimbriae regulatory protein FimW n=1 Tax=Salmonella enterica subsp. arizonae TaxID=59203 RepID=A0A2X4WIS6_SALER|nr:fimbriae regulatory protein FimW [Salmonella enterica subsp. arizonae]SUG16323.1 fimbriae regulatory protein FimW [Salmonella enterica subsp. arizonae]SUG21042.1 fimbriae regulatory protein FimW [Salmonella enterica subsp. arizonae]SUG48972.1 fimbriae regulatory protein FimW [Salmonella enterica subsp. arizonae]VDY43388.1 fimbriae regulatory protein FimW [Salmonella enterica subsp. arizonae]